MCVVNICRLSMFQAFGRQLIYVPTPSPKLKKKEYMQNQKQIDLVQSFLSLLIICLITHHSLLFPVIELHSPSFASNNQQYPLFDPSTVIRHHSSSLDIICLHETRTVIKHHLHSLGVINRHKTSLMIPRH